MDHISFIVICVYDELIHFDGYLCIAVGMYPPPRPPVPRALFSFLGSAVGDGPPRDENPVFGTYAPGAP